MPDPDARAIPPDPDAVLAQRARVLERLAGSAWHELAQPINGFHSFVDVLQLEGWTADQLGVDPALLKAAVQRLKVLGRSLTELARASAQPEPLGSIVAGVTALAGHMLADVAVEIDVPLDLPEADIDFAVVRLVVASLTSDTILALGGPREAVGHLRWTGRPVSAADGGPGSPPAGVELALEDDAPPATPADLDLLRALVAGAGGALEHEAPADPARGRGNRYRLLLPVPSLPAAGDASGAPSAVVQPASAASSTPGADLAGALLTVLVCDDDRAIGTLVQRMLDRPGILTHVATSGGQAQTVVDEAPIDVVLADYRMAGMSGPELYAAVVESRPDLRGRFVFMSGDAGDPDLVSFAESERLTVLDKPFGREVLLEALWDAASR